MPISIIIAIVSILMVIGIISLCDGILRVFLRSKSEKDTVVVLVLSDSDSIERAVRYAVKKYPAAKIMIKTFHDKSDAAMIDIMRKKYPNIVSG